MIKVKTITADSIEELDGKIAVYLETGWQLLGDMQVYKEDHVHAVHGYQVWSNKFSQRMKYYEPK